MTFHLFLAGVLLGTGISAGEDAKSTSSRPSPFGSHAKRKKKTTTDDTEQTRNRKKETVKTPPDHKFTLY